eukprot:gene53567-73242_t
MDLVKRFARDKAALLGATLLGLLIIAAIFAPWLAPYPNDVFDFHIERRLLAPTADALMGTDRRADAALLAESLRSFFPRLNIMSY